MAFMIGLKIIWSMLRSIFQRLIGSGEVVDIQSNTHGIITIVIDEFRWKLPQ
jgi:hypothetical protein